MAPIIRAIKAKAKLAPDFWPGVLRSLIAAFVGAVLTYTGKAMTLEGRVSAIETSTARIELMLISIAPELKQREAKKEH